MQNQCLSEHLFAAVRVRRCVTQAMQERGIAPRAPTDFEHTRRVNPKGAEQLMQSFNACRIVTDGIIFGIACVKFGGQMIQGSSSECFAVKSVGRRLPPCSA